MRARSKLWAGLLMLLLFARSVQKGDGLVATATPLPSNTTTHTHIHTHKRKKNQPSPNPVSVHCALHRKMRPSLQILFFVVVLALLAGQALAQHRHAAGSREEMAAAHAQNEAARH
ncbi:hypothetical protein DFJ73DRAFT_869269, partial [Zopfochytrium polystomum]